MKSKDHGLTVGELTMAIGALILAGLIWSTLTTKKESEDISSDQTSYLLLAKINQNSLYPKMKSD